MRQNIPVQQLIPGMKIVSLDIGWKNSPKWTAPFVLNTSEDLVLLLQHCKIVSIETEVSAGKAANKPALPADPKGGSDQPRPLMDKHQGTLSPNSSPTSFSKVSEERVNQENQLKKRQLKNRQLKNKVSKQFVINSFHECMDILIKNFKRVRAGERLDAASIRSTTNKLLISTLVRPNTLALLSQLEEKDNSLERKSLDVAILSLSFARSLGLPKEKLHKLGMSALLHDIGMTKIPDQLLNQKEALSIRQRISIQKHVSIGCDIINESLSLRPLVRAIAYHHERFDGTGYPSGLKGRNIPLESRILSIITTYEALTRNRHFSKRNTPTQALRKLYSWRNLYFDGLLVERFIRSVGVYPVGTLVELNKQQIGMVIDVNAQARSRPVVHCLFDSQGQLLAKQRDFDLTDQKFSRVKITRTVEPKDIEGFSLQRIADNLGFGHVA